MTFPQLLLRAFQRSEIPLRFEPGAEEALAKPIIELLKAWLMVHAPEGDPNEGQHGEWRLILRLIEELEGRVEIPE